MEDVTVIGLVEKIVTTTEETETETPEDVEMIVAAEARATTEEENTEEEVHLGLAEADDLIGINLKYIVFSIVIKFIPNDTSTSEL